MWGARLLQGGGHAAVSKILLYTDGAPAMVGNNADLQTQVRKMAPCAVWMHYILPTVFEVIKSCKFYQK